MNNKQNESAPVSVDMAHGHGDRTVISLSAKRAEADGTAAQFCPLIKFPHDDAGFVLGYEVGLLFGRLDAKPATWSGTYHADNEDMLRETATVCGYDVKIESSGDAAWVFAQFTRRTIAEVLPSTR
jgi:hypothetical protein